MTEKLQRRQWAQSRISELAQERDRLDRRIEELKAFIALLDQSDAALAGPNGSRPVPRPRGPGRGRRSRGGRRQKRALADYLVTALKNAGPAGADIKLVTDAVIQAGYVHEGKARLTTTVASELNRQMRKGKRGIVRLGTGRYAVTSGAAVRGLFDERQAGAT